MHTHRLSVITPCLNAETAIGDTIHSILLNKAIHATNLELEYIVCDGNSTDNTLDTIDSFFKRNKTKNIQLKIISENDTSMYDALSKGLHLVTGNICTYINAGDLFSPTAFEIVIEIFNNSKVKWLTGLIAQYNEKYHLTRVWLPFKYSNRLIRKGFYNYRFLPFIQQEGTFWSTNLNNHIDLKALSQFKYAGDFYIWKTFAGIEKLYIVEALLSGYKIHKGQLSSNMRAYYKEMDLIADAPGLFDYIYVLYERILLYSPNRIKRLLNTDTIFTFNHRIQKYVL